MYRALIAIFRPLGEAFRVRLFAYLYGFLPTILHKLSGELDDLSCLDILWHDDSALWLYLTPWLTPAGIHWIWSAKWILAGSICAAIIALFSLRSLGLLTRNIITVANFFWLHRQLLGECKIFSIRGSFIRLCDALQCTRYYLEKGLILRSRNVVDTSTPEFQYSTLKGDQHIRLLRLDRRGLSHHITCHLVEFPITRAPRYDALSYTWGVEPPSIPIQINGRKKLVTESVEDFLINHRSIFCARYVWIDAICINQTDQAEKAKQIMLMGTVYRQARCVLVWLAPPKSPSNAVDIRDAMTWPYLFESVKNVTDQTRLAGLLDASWNSIHAEIGHFLLSPWFGRMWVIQELSMARNVHVLYRNACLPWLAVEKLCRQFMQAPAVSHRVQAALRASNHDGSYIDSKLNVIKAPYNARTMDLVRNKFREGEGVSLLQCLQISTIFQCKDPRDHIFSMINLLDQQASSYFQPNYTISDEALCYKLAEYVVSSDEWFKGLRDATFTFEGKRLLDPSASRLPSWVHDLRVQYSLTSFAAGRILIVDHNIYYQQRPRIIQSSHGPTLQGEYVIIGNIQGLGKSLEFRSLSDTSADTNPSSANNVTDSQLLAGVASAKDLQDFYLASRDLVRSYLTSHSVSHDTANQIFWEVCTYALTKADAEIPSNILRPREPLARKIFEHHTHTYARVGNERELQAPDIPKYFDGIDRRALAETYLFLMEYFSQNLLGQRLCILSTGQVALVPRQVEQGDVVAHMRGGLAPVVLRRSNSQATEAELVGLAYVYNVPDIYHGTGWEMWSLI